MRTHLGSLRLAQLVQELSRLPGIGQKSATRIALHLLEGDAEAARALSEAILEMKAHVHPCRRCGAIAEEDECELCRDPRRDPHSLCVVGQPTDIFSMERAAVFRGRYHVLGGLLSPLEGVDPSDLRLAELELRVRAEAVREVVLALAGTVEGEATALFVARMLTGHPVSVTRLATGIPVGGDLEYVDEVTLERAFAGRRPLG
jgi:recombination protein RecR